MIVIDYSSVAIAAITVFKEDLQKDPDHIENLAKHVILSTIKGYKKQFSKEFGNEVVIACDCRDGYWRKDIFPYYKYKRKQQREESDIPWDQILRCMDIVKKDLIEFFPYKVIEVSKAEADDIFGVMAQDVAFLLTANQGLDVGDVAPEKTVLITSDGDSAQLLTHPNIRQWTPYVKKFVKLEMTAKEFLRRKILKGDSGDGIPNSFSPLDSFYTGIRQKPATEKKMAPMLEAKNMLDAAPDEFVKQRIQENARLISFALMPKELRAAIIEAYNVPPKGNKMSILRYLIANDMKLMMNDVDQF